MDTKDKTIPVRLLQDCAYGKCNDVAEVPASELKSLKDGGLADDTPAAVAYAKSLKRPKPEPQA